jgi:hypothetical protein
VSTHSDKFTLNYFLSDSSQTNRYETGRPLKVINFSRLLSSTSGAPTESGEDSVVRAIFKDAALMDAIIVFDGLDPRAMEDIRGLHQLVLSELLHEVERYNGCVILHFTPTTALTIFVVVSPPPPPLRPLKHTYTHTHFYWFSAQGLVALRALLFVACIQKEQAPSFPLF